MIKFKELLEESKEKSKYMIYHDAHGRWVQLGGTYYVVIRKNFKRIAGSDSWKKSIVFGGSSKAKCQEWIKKKRI